MKIISRAGVPLAAILLVAGCGGAQESSTENSSQAAAAGAKQSTALEVVHAAYEKTTKAQSAKVAMGVSVTKPGGGSPVKITADGAVDMAAHAAKITVHPPNAEALQIRVIDTTTYVQLPPKLQAKVGKSWLKVTPQDVQQQSGLNLEQLQTQNTDPSKTLSYVRAVSDQVKKVGTETVRGAETTKYEATVDLDKLVQQQPSEKQSVDKLKQALGTSQLPITLWIDDQNRVRRLQMTIPVPAQNGQATDGKITMTEELYDFGVDVSAKAPPAGDTTTLGALKSAQGH